VDKDLRASLLAACIAAALSALVGIIAGVGAVALLLRAVALGLVAGAATYGAIAMLKQSVPELLESDVQEGKDEGLDSMLEDSDVGANVDIVLPGEAPSADPSPADAPRRASSAEDAQPAFAAELASDGGLEPVGGAEGPRAPEPATLLGPEEGSSSGVAALPVGVAGGEGRGPSPGYDDLDVLPDLDGFSDSFTASEFGSGNSSSDRPDAKGGASAPSGSSRPSSGIGPGNLDAVAVAQAVRTILKRDQKG